MDVEWKNNASLKISDNAMKTNGMRGHGSAIPQRKCHGVFRGYKRGWSGGEEEVHRLSHSVVIPGCFCEEMDGMSKFLQFGLFNIK